MRLLLVLARRRVLTIWRTTNPALMTSRGADDDLSFTIGREEIDIRHRWETASIVNDVLVGLWFLAGSIMFLFENLMTVGTWFFIIGSAELLARPLIKLGRNIHVGNVRRQGS